ncbi:hypothetical protein BKA82DRAFT_4016986 [Pisolithus tinctorius]|nr:hypothetical protein BKA82DRAFT_4016986 [Pisolithus tinctorius]
MPAVQRSGSGCPATVSLQEEGTHLTIDQSNFIGQNTIRQLVKGDIVSMLDIVQRHGSVSFSLGNVTDEWEALDILNKADATYVIWVVLLEPGMEDPSVFIKDNIKGT